MINYQPKGSMCAACDNKLKDCSTLDFKSMPVMVKLGTVKVVRCIKFIKEKGVQPNGDRTNT